MRIALFSSQGAVGLPTEYGVHVREVARMLRLLGHECLLVGLASRSPRDAASGHAGGTRRRLLADFGGHGDLPGATELLEEERPDVLWLLQWRKSRQMLEAAAGFGIPVVADLHGLFCPVDAWTSGETRLDRQLAEHAAHPGYEPDDERYVLAASQLVVARFDWDAESAGREGVEQARIRRVPFGIRYATANGQGPLGPRPSGAELRAAFAGPLVHTAGAHLLLDAMALVPELPVRLVMEARGPGNEDYEELVTSRAGDDPRITVVLDAPARTSPIASGAADLLVVPSLVPGACPVVALSAGASGVWVAASQAAGPGIPFADGEASVFETGSAAAIAEVLERFATLPPEVPPRPYVPGIEEEALEMERLAGEVVGCSVAGGGRAVGSDATADGGSTRLVGGGIDFPHHRTSVRRAAVKLAGWALTDPHPVSRIEVKVNGEPVGRARLALARPTLLEAFGAPEAVVSGWEHWVDLTEIAEAVTGVRFDVEIVALDGTRLPLWPVEVELEPPERPDPADVGRFGILEGRLRRVVAGAGAARLPAGEVRLAAFTHGLGLGGAQLYLFELLRCLRERPGFSCTVVSPSDGQLRENFEALGIPVLVSGYPGVSDPDLYVGRQLEIAAWMRHEGFNVVLGNTLLAFPWVDMAERLGLPAVWAIHESYDLSTFLPVHLPGAKVHPVVRDRLAAALGSAAAVVFEADATRRMFEGYGDARRFVKVDYGIDLSAIRAYRAGFDRAAARADLGIPAAADVILFIGTIEPRKSQAMLAEAFRWVSAAHPLTYLVLVGDAGGAYPEAVRDYLDASGLGKRSRVVEVVEDTYAWYGVADLFVCPSDLESLPRSVLEAMAFDVPVAAAGAFGVPELIEDGRTGYICETRDLASLRTMLRRVLSEPRDVRRAVGLAGGRVVAGRHDSSGYAAAYDHLLRALVEDPRVLPGDVLKTAVRSPARG